MSIIFDRLKIVKNRFDAVSNGNHLDLILPQAFAKSLNLQKVAILLLISDAVNEIFQVLAECVWFVVSNHDAFVGYLNFINKRYCMVAHIRPKRFGVKVISLIGSLKHDIACYFRVYVPTHLG